MTHWQNNFTRPEGQMKQGEARREAATHRERLLNDSDRFRGNSKGTGRGFASMDEATRREIASMGGKAAHAMGKAHTFTPEEARAAALKARGVEPNPVSTGIAELNAAFGIGPAPAEPPPSPTVGAGVVTHRKLYTYNGESLDVREWAERLGIHFQTLASRLTTYGWTIERAMKQRVRKRGPNKTSWVQLELELVFE